MRISDWSSDVCSSDLLFNLQFFVGYVILDNGYLYLLLGLLLSLVFLIFPAARSAPFDRVPWYDGLLFQIGRASCRERVCQYVSISVVAVSLTKTQVCST